MDILFSDFRKKDVIDVCSGKKLGKVKDLTFNYPEGRILCLTISGGMFGCGEEITIKFDRIEKVGEDAILVRTEEKREHCPAPQKNPCPPEPPHGPCPPNGNAAQGRPPFPRFDDGDYE